MRISKSALKARMLEYFRRVEETGEELIVTVIVATALIAGIPLLPRDRALHDFGGVPCIW